MEVTHNCKENVMNIKKGTIKFSKILKFMLNEKQKLWVKLSRQRRESTN